MTEPNTTYTRDELVHFINIRPNQQMILNIPAEIRQQEPGVAPTAIPRAPQHFFHAAIPQAHIEPDINPIPHATGPSAT